MVVGQDRRWLLGRTGDGCWAGVHTYERTLGPHYYESRVCVCVWVGRRGGGGVGLTLKIPHYTRNSL